MPRYARRYTAVHHSMTKNEVERYTGNCRVLLSLLLGCVRRAAADGWNSPIILGARNIATAVAAGCTVVFKVSESCPQLHHLLVQIFEDAGLPKGILNVIQANRDMASEVTEYEGISCDYGNIKELSTILSDGNFDAVISAFAPPLVDMKAVYRVGVEGHGNIKTATLRSTFRGRFIIIGNIT